MASHDVLRTSRGPVSDEDRKQEAKKIEAYKKLESQINEAIKADDFSEQTLHLTSKLLKGATEHNGNPEYYTIWNHRRRVLLNLFANHSSSIASRLRSELAFQLPLLKKYPKCYWLWNHRRWILAQASSRLAVSEAREFWQEEFALDNMMLSRDNRNFHGWNYRRGVLKELQKFSSLLHSSASIEQDKSNLADANAEREKEKKAVFENEFAYTRKMASSSLSNFSALHQRANLIPAILELRKASEADRRALFDDELTYIREAVLSDPWNQSLWFYHDYMMVVLSDNQSVIARTDGKDEDMRHSWVQFTNRDREKYLSNEIQAVKEVLDDTDDCKWIYQSLLGLCELCLEVDAGNHGSVFTTQNLRHWLDKLEAIDPLRKGRWRDWGVKLGLYTDTT